MSKSAADAVAQEARKMVFRLLRRGKYLVGHDPLLLPVLLRLTPMGISRAITDSTDLVIEGFPRCGNTFTVTGIQFAADHRIQIASHVHHPSQIKLARQRGVPTLIVVRDPLDALSSYLTYGQHGRPQTVIREYCSYHRELLPYLDEVLVSDFTVNVTKLSETIARINERFAMSIPPFDQSPENTQQVFEEISHFHKLTHPTLNPSIVAPRPQTSRKETADRFRAELDSPRYAHLMAQARDLYAYYVLKADGQRATFERARRLHGEEVSGRDRDVGSYRDGRVAKQSRSDARRRKADPNYSAM